MNDIMATVLEGIKDKGLAEARGYEIAALKKRIGKLEAALDQVEEYLDGRVDVVDGDYGAPAPNREMSLMTAIREARGTHTY